MVSEARGRGRPSSPTEGAADAVDKINTLKKRLKMTDDVLAKLIGVNQTTVSRALGRREPAWTPSMRKLCEYAENMHLLAEGRIGTAQGGKAEDTLKQAVLDAWDGTPEGLNSLVRVLVTLRDYRRPKKAGVVAP